MTEIQVNLTQPHKNEQVGLCWACGGIRMTAKFFDRVVSEKWYAFTVIFVILLGFKAAYL